ncbi:MAG: hypothetical protein KKD25_17815 [Gammaproteobacteria bacterium]|nr:hypothetical protein [Gammaproteobacteria bacterium]MBU0770066.1 hypothetical protein [Gammaproteobacteria bacterium]MBU0855625.1 hypothetical protein [Gammaproteobacteria bacterium]MBU1848541.1 hypothetical protein [Gammaproteobacteria bacterium]
MLKPSALAESPATQTGRRSRTVTLNRLLQGYGIPASRICIFEDMGIIVAAGAQRYRCADDDLLIIAAAAVQLGFTVRELRELMGLYREASPSQRALPDFMKLLAGYQRLMAWRQPTGADGEAGRGSRRPFRARQYRLSLVAEKAAS